MSSDDRYYSEKEKGERTSDQETLGQPFWGGFVAIVRARLADGSLEEIVSGFYYLLFEFTALIEKDKYKITKA